MFHHLIIHNDKAVCPRCDGNGSLYKTTLQPLNLDVIMCDECDSIWPISTQEFTNSNFQDFTTYVQSLEYTYDDVDLTNITYDWFIPKI